MCTHLLCLFGTFARISSSSSVLGSVSLWRLLFCGLADCLEPATQRDTIHYYNIRHTGPVCRWTAMCDTTNVSIFILHTIMSVTIRVDATSYQSVCSTRLSCLSASSLSSVGMWTVKCHTCVHLSPAMPEFINVIFMCSIRKVPSTRKTTAICIVNNNLYS